MKNETEFHMKKLSWILFYIMCLENKDWIWCFDIKPIFRIIIRIDQHDVSKNLIRYLNQYSNLFHVFFIYFGNKMKIVIDQKQLHRSNKLFKKLFVIELIDAGFDRPADINYWILQFSWIQKIHHNHIWKDMISFVELQDMTHKYQHSSPENINQEKKLWLARLQNLHQQAQNVNSIISQKTSECSENSKSQASLDED